MGIGFVNLTLKDLESIYVGKKVHVITNSFDSIDTWGIVKSVDESGTLHGTWGNFVVTPGLDYIGLND